MYNNMKITQFSVCSSAIDFHHKHYFFFKIQLIYKKILDLFAVSLQLQYQSHTLS